MPVGLGAWISRPAVLAELLRALPPEDREVAAQGSPAFSWYEISKESKGLKEWMRDAGLEALPSEGLFLAEPPRAPGTNKALPFYLYNRKVNAGPSHLAAALAEGDFQSAALLAHFLGAKELVPLRGPTARPLLSPRMLNCALHGTPCGGQADPRFYTALATALPNWGTRECVYSQAEVLAFAEHQRSAAKRIVDSINAHAHASHHEEPQEPPKIITCCDCSHTFPFSVREQKMFKDRSFSDPVRCSACREKKKQQQQGQGGGMGGARGGYGSGGGRGAPRGSSRGGGGRGGW